MRELRYENKGTSAYLVYEIRSDDVIDSMSLGMLTNNQIDGIAPTMFIQMDDRKYVKFNISGKVSATQLFEGPVNKARLIGVLSGIITAMMSAEEYMLDPQALPLGLDYIFVDPKTSETVMICLPVENISEMNADLGIFFKNILFRTQFDQTENCDHVAQILNFLSATPSLSLSDFRDLLNHLSSPGGKAVTYTANTADNSVIYKDPDPDVMESKPQDQNTPGTNHIPVKNDPIDENLDDDQNADDEDIQDEGPSMSLLYLLQHYSKENAAAYKAQQDKKKVQQDKKKAPKDDSKKKPQKPKEASNSAFSMDFAVPGQNAEVPVKKDAPLPKIEKASPESTASQPEHLDYGDTVLLVDKAPDNDVTTAFRRAYLIRPRTGDRVDIIGDEFTIGRKKSAVNYCIDNNKTVSGTHAKIVNHNGEYFVVDLKSSNYTYVNGRMIQSHEEVILANGTKLCFSDEEFEFHLD